MTNPKPIGNPIPSPSSQFAQKYLETKRPHSLNEEYFSLPCNVMKRKQRVQQTDAVGMRRDDSECLEIKPYWEAPCVIRVI